MSNRFALAPLNRPAFPSRSSFRRGLRIMVVAALVVVLTGTLAAAPALAQEGNGSDDGSGAAVPNEAQICNNGLIDLMSQAMILLQVFGLGLALLVTQTNAIRRMFGGQSAEQAAQRMAQVKKGTATLVAGPPLFVLFMQLAGLPLLNCMVNQVPLV